MNRISRSRRKIFSKDAGNPRARHARRAGTIRRHAEAARRWRRPNVERLEERMLLAALPPDGLVSWWRAENNAADFAGSNNGVMQNGATFAAGQVGQAFSFDGIDDYVELGNDASLNPATITVEAWWRGLCRQWRQCDRQQRDDPA